MLTRLKPWAWIVSVFALWSTAIFADPVTDLAEDAPPMANLLHQYPNHQGMLERYADIQGFSRPYERLATVVHELIHIDSLANRGYWINGAVYLRPYITDAIWPTLKNSDLLSQLPDGPITHQYVRGTPANGLANCLDEINAYSHVIGFVAWHEPESLPKQVQNLRGLLLLAEAYSSELKRRGEALSADAAAVANIIVRTARRILASLNCTDIPDPWF